MTKLDRLVWADQSTFRFGDLHLGVRTSTAEVGHALRRLLPDAWVPDVEAPANYSLHVGRDEGATRGVHVLYRGWVPVVRSRGIRRVVDGLISYMAGAAAPLPEGMLPLGSIAFERDGGVYLFPASLRYRLERIEPRLRRVDARLVDVPAVSLRLADGTLVVEPPPVRVDAAVLDELDRAHPTPPREASAVPPGVYPIRGIAYLGPADAAPSRAAAVMATAQESHDIRSIGPDVALEGLARAANAARVTPLPDLAHTDVLTAFERMRSA